MFKLLNTRKKERKKKLQFIDRPASMPYFVSSSRKKWAMSNGSGSSRLRCNWFQIRTTTHISAQVIIWISASRWWWKQGWSNSCISSDKHQGGLETHKYKPPCLFPAMQLLHTARQTEAKGPLKILYSAQGYDSDQHRAEVVFVKWEVVMGGTRKSSVGALRRIFKLRVALNALKI